MEADRLRGEALRGSADFRRVMTGSPYLRCENADREGCGEPQCVEALFPQSHRRCFAAAFFAEAVGHNTGSRRQLPR
jgi:hypothetical protein